MMPTEDTIDIMNRMFKNDEFEWTEIDFANIPSATKVYLDLIKDYASIKIHKVSVQGIYIFNIDHPTVKYLIHDPALSAHMWGDSDFENIDNNKALSAIWGEPDMKKVFDRLDDISESQNEEG